MAVAAKDFGLIPFEAVVEETEQVDCQSSCHCMGAAHQILDQHFSTKNNRKGLPKIDIDKAKKAFDQDTETYKKKLEKAAQQKRGSDGCASLAPAIFDFLLQEVRRHP